MPANGSARRRVVIVGGGFGGLAAAHKLHDADVDVTLIDRKNHHLFQPLLYQAPLGGLSASDCASPIRPALKRGTNTGVLMAEITDVDAENRQVVLDRGDRLDYDSLIVACGGETSYFGNDEWQDVSCGLAITAAAMKRSFRRIDPGDARVILLDAGDRRVAAFSKKLSGKVSEELAQLGVTVREGARATAIDAGGVAFEAHGAGERIDARTVVWAAGIRAAALTAALARATGAGTDRTGRIKVNPNLTVAGHPEISVIGDVASLEGPGGKPLPGLATVAIQQAHHVAKGIHRGGPGASEPFRNFDKGALAVVGRGRAVCEIRGLDLWGRLAFFTYLGVHLYYLGGQMCRRLEVLIKWFGARFGERQSALIEGELGTVERVPPPVQSAR